MSQTIAEDDLRPPTLADYEKAEGEFQRQHITLIAQVIASLPPQLRQDVALKAIGGLDRGAFSHGSAAFASWAFSAAGLHTLAWISFRVKFPRMTLAGATKMVNRNNPDGRLAKQIWDLWGFQRRSVSQSEIAASADAAADRIFQDIMAAEKLTARQFAGLPGETLVKLVRNRIGDRPIDKARVIELAAAYAKRNAPQAASA